MQLSSRQKKIKSIITKATDPGSRRDALIWREVLGRKIHPTATDFVQACIPVRDKATGIPQKFVFNRPQRLLAYTRNRRDRFGEPIRDAILKARQFGISTYMVAEGHAMSLLTDDLSAAIVANKGPSSSRLLDLARWQSKKLPDVEGYRPKTTRNNRSLIHYDDPWNSVLEIDTASAEEPLRSGTFRWVHCSETAFWPDPDRAVAAINAVVPTQPGTYLSHESTANGMGNWWYDFWWAARNKKSGYWGWFFPWWFDPEFDYSIEPKPKEAEEIEATLDEEEMWLVNQGVGIGGLNWRRKMIESYKGNSDVFHQEYPAMPEEAFLVSGRPVFAPEMVKAALANCKPPVWRGEIRVAPRRDDDSVESVEGEFVELSYGNLSIWKHPDPKRSYAMGIDSGEGVGLDYTVACVIDMDTLEQVAVWCSNRTEPYAAGRICAALGVHYRMAYILPEAKGPGIALIRAMVNANYPRIGLRQVYDSASGDFRDKHGIDPNMQTKPVAIDKLREALHEGLFPINDERLPKEMMVYAAQLSDSGRVTFAAPHGKHDDHVMAAAYALVGRQDAFERGQAYVEPERGPSNYNERVWKHIEEEEAPAMIALDDEDADFSFLEDF